MKTTVNTYGENRFEEHFQHDPNSGCWLWTGKTLGPYGRYKLDGKDMGAHRAAYILYKGDPQERFVCHSCDTPLCVNPDHLWLGTHDENMADMATKGRAKRVGRPKSDPVSYHRPGVRLDQQDKALLDKLVRVYGSEAQAVRVAIRVLAERYQ